MVHLLRNVVAKAANNGWIVSGSGTPDSLKLATPKQVTAFIRHIEDTLCEGMDAEVFACYKNEMMKGKGTSDCESRKEYCSRTRERNAGAAVILVRV